MSPEPQFYVRTTGRVLGPMPWRELKDLESRGEVGADTEVACQDATASASEPLRFVPFRDLRTGEAPCSRCGGPGAAPRHVMRVRSMLVVTKHERATEFLCGRCGSRVAAKALLGSGFLGWWGVPWGLIRTPAALVTNARTLFGTRAFPAFGTIGLLLVALAVPVAAVLGVMSLEAT
jgi:hypothetical protein